MSIETATTAQLFATLNTLRVQNGKAPLKAWKESRAKLVAAINAEAPAAPVTPAEPSKVASLPVIDPSLVVTPTSTETTQEKTARLREARKANEAKDAALAALEAESPSPTLEAQRQENLKANETIARRDSAKAFRDAAVSAAKKTIKKSRTAAKAAKAGFSAAQIIAEFGIAPKVGRALLRKHKVAKTPEAVRKFFQDRAK